VAHVELLQQLWGCTVTDFEIDLINHRVCMVVDCHRRVDQPDRHRVEILELVSLTLDTEPPFVGGAYFDEPWNYIELMSIEATRIERDGHDLWKIEAELWVSTLESVCRDIDVEKLAGLPVGSNRG
jgi:hypothetical protein